MGILASSESVEVPSEAYKARGCLLGAVLRPSPIGLVEASRPRRRGRLENNHDVSRAVWCRAVAACGENGTLCQSVSMSQGQVSAILGGRALLLLAGLDAVLPCPRRPAKESASNGPYASVYCPFHAEAQAETLVQRTRTTQRAWRTPRSSGSRPRSSAASSSLPHSRTKEHSIGANEPSSAQCR